MGRFLLLFGNTSSVPAPAHSPDSDDVVELGVASEAADVTSEHATLSG